ncbi:hypothetical protein FB45DRAFT_1025922 [Roridomyces roridus]|uniref:Uncharacterized protein n=1 Tax=Roridomyces roridus TaxID=1738132 RepID=A0AAD7BZP2_9AGAR|nr:hypothetical protein FB45DRAFT_1025922 [Roridomyces roridus]
MQLRRMAARCIVTQTISASILRSIEHVCQDAIFPHRRDWIYRWHPNAASFHFTVLVRDPKKAEKFNEIPGVTSVVGSLDDIPLVTKLVSEADIVVGVPGGTAIHNSTSITTTSVHPKLTFSPWDASSWKSIPTARETPIHF